MKIVLIVASLAIAAYFFFKRFNGANNLEKEITYGPFTIRVEAKTSSSFNLDKGSVTNTNVAYSIYYKGKPVPFPSALERNTGLRYLWRVYALSGTPDPTLLAGSQSLFLIYLKNGVPVVEPILEQYHDFASLQFLDNENGQPGPYMEVFAKNSTQHLDQLDTLQGGRYLMVSEHSVVDVHTRKIQPFNPENNSVENYSFPEPHGALAFSPDRKSIVFRSAFQSWNALDEDLPDSEHALVVYHIEQDKGYVIKFDDTELRMCKVEDMDFSWFEKFFEWEKTATGEQLQLRKLARPPFWTGRFKVEYETSPWYTLYPIKASILPVFLTFLEKQVGWTKDSIVEDKYHEYTGRVLTFASGNLKFDVTLKEDEQTLQLSRHMYNEGDQEYVATAKKIADAFEAELAAGKHQEHFGRIISQVKKIRGLDQNKE